MRNQGVAMVLRMPVRVDEVVLFVISLGLVFAQTLPDAFPHALLELLRTALTLGT